jgi:flagellar motor switch protein FliG
MSELTLTHAAGQLSICLSEAWPELSPTEDGNYRLRCYSAGDDTVDVMLDATALEQLGRACLPHLRPISPVRTTAEAEAPFREPAYFLKDLDNRAIQLLLREMQSESLIVFLWYMKDPDLIRKMLGNFSERAASMLMDDLFARGGGNDPNSALLIEAEVGRTVVREVLELVTRLAEEGNALGAKRT